MIQLADKNLLNQDSPAAYRVRSWHHVYLSMRHDRESDILLIQRRSDSILDHAPGVIKISIQPTSINYPEKLSPTVSWHCKI